VIDGQLVKEETSYGNTKSIETENKFFIGGIDDEVKDSAEAQRNLMVIKSN